ncbi:MAG: FecR domain-containing protein [Cyanophyceae cyanobacterium]
MNQLTCLKNGLSHGLATGILLTFWLSPAVAQSVLTRAEIYKKENQVELERQNQGVWNAAAVGDAMVPGDALRTAARSRAELLFNEGTLLRTGEGSVFRFPPGKRRFELVSGAALVMIRPGIGTSTITTPQATIVSQGTALFIQHDASRNASLVGVLTNSPMGPVTVTNQAGEVVVELRAGQFVSIANGIVGLVEYFILPMFYDSIELAAGLGTGQENLVAQESPEVQATINAVRDEALAPLSNQVAWLSGFCGLNLSAIQASPLLQWLWPATVPAEEIILRLPESDIFVTPFRSLTGLLWLGNYCQSNPDLSIEHTR